MLTKSSKYPILAMAIVAVLLLVNCDSPTEVGFGTFIVQWEFTEPGLFVNFATDNENQGESAEEWPERVEKITITVDADDMDPITKDISDTAVYGTYIYYIPAGSNRRVTVDAFNANDYLRYSGQVTVLTLQDMQELTVDVTLSNEVPLWFEYDSPTTQRLAAVDMISASDGWICGENGTVLHYNGSTWSAVNSGYSYNYNDISFSSSVSGWIVGWAGVAIRYNNGTFTKVDVPNNPDLYAVLAVSETEAWAGGRTGVIYKWNGSVWAKQYSPIEGQYDVNTLCKTPANVKWAGCGRGRILTSPGGWHVDHIVSGNPYLVGISFPSSNEGWAVGENGKIVHYVGGSGWASEYSGTSENLRNVSMVSTTFGIAVGENGVICEYDEDTWYLSYAPTGSVGIGSVDCVSETEAWAVGNDGIMLHYAMNE